MLKRRYNSERKRIYHISDRRKISRDSSSYLRRLNILHNIALKETYFDTVIVANSFEICPCYDDASRGSTFAVFRIFRTCGNSGAQRGKQSEVRADDQQRKYLSITIRNKLTREPADFYYTRRRRLCPIYSGKRKRANTIYLQSSRRESSPRAFGTRVTPQRERKYNSANYACHRKPLSAARISEIMSPPNLQKYIATRKIRQRRHRARSPTKVSGFVNYVLQLGKLREKEGRDITTMTTSSSSSSSSWLSETQSVHISV